ATLTLLSVAGQQANAGQIYQDWNYGIDSFSDGSGGSSYEIKGIATKQVGDQIYVALTGGMPLAGVDDGGTNIGWSDLFLNFSGKDFQTASNDKDLFAVRFVNNNNTSIATGVYTGVDAKSITASHNGYGSLKQYYNYGYDRTDTQGTDFSTQQSVYNYYQPSAVANNPTTSNTPILNAINSGTKVGNISMLSALNLSAAGLDFGYFNALGTQTIGFSFDKNLIANGNYIANIFLDCGNDAVALKGNVKSTPEPTTTAGLFVVGLVFGMTQIRKSRKTALS
ncbi:MAG: PEP-CTERM sorting domain-containing protein, partial [Dolichospermum sp.]|nr:PEP-CTERM sorting domain-containing protein [Dolichospermum sp.]